jgi:hypothetical protein
VVRAASPTPLAEAFVTEAPLLLIVMVIQSFTSLLYMYINIHYLLAFIFLIKVT